jgi:hypothetical protein
MDTPAFFLFPFFSGELENSAFHIRRSPPMDDDARPLTNFDDGSVVISKSDRVTLLFAIAAAAEREQNIITKLRSQPNSARAIAERRRLRDGRNLEGRAHQR